MWPPNLELLTMNHTHHLKSIDTPTGMDTIIENPTVTVSTSTFSQSMETPF